MLGDKHIHEYTADKKETQPRPQRDVVDVLFEEVDTHFCHITEFCREKNMVEHVENTLRVACMGDAKTLWARIHDFELMKFLDSENVPSEQLYRDICDFFGQLKYTSRNFNKYRFSSK